MGFETFVIDRMRKGQPIIVHGDGSSLWAACHRDDVARAFVGAAGNPTAYGKAYHVTAKEWLTWDRYYRHVAQAAGAPDPELVHIPTDLLLRAAPERASWCAENFSFNNIFDNTAARNDLGFCYTIPFVEGMARAIAWMDAHDMIEPSESYPYYDRMIDAWKTCSDEMVCALGGA